MAASIVGMTPRFQTISSEEWIHLHDIQMHRLECTYKNNSTPEAAIQLVVGGKLQYSFRGFRNFHARHRAEKAWTRLDMVAVAVTSEAATTCHRPVS